MTVQQLSDALNQIDDELLPAGEREEKTAGKKRPWLRLGAAAACLCLVAAGVFAATGPHPDAAPVWPTREVPLTYGAAGDQEAVVPENQLFHWLTWRETEYTPARTEADAGGLGEPLGEAEQHYVGPDGETAVGIDYESVVMAYALPDISPDCAIQIELPSGVRDVYINTGYRPADLGALLDDLNLREELSFGSAFYLWHKPDGTYATVEFTGPLGEEVWERLLSRTGTPAVENYDSLPLANIMSVSISIPALGYQNISLGVTADGYLTTNLLATGKAFYLGTEVTEGFVEAILARCDGEELVYVREDPVPEAEVAPGPTPTPRVMPVS